jgi:hypothetical protein
MGVLPLSLTLNPSLRGKEPEQKGHWVDTLTTHKDDKALPLGCPSPLPRSIPVPPEWWSRAGMLSSWELTQGNLLEKKLVGSWRLC